MGLNNVDDLLSQLPEESRALLQWMQPVTLAQVSWWEVAASVGVGGVASFVGAAASASADSGGDTSSATTVAGCGGSGSSSELELSSSE